MIAALYDIHGNMPALEAVLDEIRTLGVDEIVLGGDVVVGPMSEECMDLLLSLDIKTYFIKGNCEVSVVDHFNGRSSDNLPEDVKADIRWTATTLQRHKSELLTWPLTIERNVEGVGKILFCHATPRNENEIFTHKTKIDKLTKILNPVGADIVVCGHTHIQFDIVVGKKRIINAGSVGMPFGRKGAHWLLIDREPALRITEYNFEKAAMKVLNTSYPGAKEFANTHILDPPSEELMLKIFSKAELR